MGEENREGRKGNSKAAPVEIYQGVNTVSIIWEMSLELQSYQPCSSFLH